MSESGWSSQMEDRLREIWLGDYNLKKHLSEFGDRTYGAVVAHAHSMGLGPRPYSNRGRAHYAYDAALEALKKGRGNVAQIAERAGLSHQGVGMYFKPSLAGLNSDFHIVDWERRPQGGSYIPVYAFGPGENQPKPAAKSNAQLCREKRDRARKERQKQGFRPRFTNPFAVAAGFVAPVQTQSGRVYQQPMDFRDEEKIGA